MDCTDIKAMLSALLDDRVAPADRHRAERHLAECTACRDLVSDAERNEVLVAAALEAGNQPQGLPPGFEEAVLTRTTRIDGGPRRWTMWLGWLAAAAALALAATVWQIDGGAASIQDPAGRVITEVYEAPSELRSWPRDADELGPPRRLVPNEIPAYLLDASDTAGPVTTEVSAVSTWSRSLPREDLETLEGASLLLAMLREGSENGFAGVDHARQVIEYDELLPRLARVRARLLADERAAVLAAESVLYRIARGPISETQLREMRQAIVRLRLPQRIDAIGTSPPPASSL